MIHTDDTSFKFENCNVPRNKIKGCPSKESSCGSHGGHKNKLGTI